MKHNILISCNYSRAKVYEDIYNIIEGYNNRLSSEKESVIFLNYNIGNFPNGEFSLNIQLDNFAEGGILTIIHPILDAKSLLELCFILDGIYRNLPSLNNLQIKLHFPYIAYGRQDRMFKKGDSVPIEVILEIILSHCHFVTEMHFYDIHSDACLKKIPKKIRTYNHSFNEMFYKICPHYIYNIFEPSTVVVFRNMVRKLLDKSTVVVAPDIGAIKRARDFALCIKSNFDIAIIDKIRTNIGESHVMNIVGEDVQNKICVITDDIVDSAGTLCNAANMLKEKGATKVYACITHGIFSGDAIDKIKNSEIDKLFVTDSNTFDTKDCEKIQIIPLGALFACNELSNRFKNHAKFHDIIEEMYSWDVYFDYGYRKS